MFQSSTIRCWRTDADRARFRDLGLWRDETLAELFDAHVPAQRDKLAIADAEVRWTYGHLQDVTLRLAQALLDLGVTPGDRVAAQLPSSALQPAVHLACNRIGALFVPLSTSWGHREVEGVLRTVDPPVLIAARHERDADLKPLHEEIRRDLPSLEHVLYTRGSGPESFDTLVADTAPLSSHRAAERRPDPGAPALVMLSSGTTGAPKASVWGGHDAVTFLVDQFAARFELTPDDVAAGLAPSNVGSTGYVFPVLAPLLTGASGVMLERWSPAQALELIVAERCTFATAIPTQLVMMLELPLEEADMSHFTRFNNAGAPLAPDVAEQVEARFGCRVHTVYGATDGGVPVMTAVSDPKLKRQTTVGRVNVGMELELRDPDGRRAPEGEPGEVCWRGANKSYGYFNQPDYDAAAYTDDWWFRSGDLGRIDDDGYLRIVGRTKEMILRGGHNVYPVEVESLLVCHPHVSDAVVIGVPDARLGERACAVLVPVGATPTVDDLSRFLGDQGLALYKHPERLVVVDQLPVNAGGKVDRPRIRQVALERLP